MAIPMKIRRPERGIGAAGAHRRNRILVGVAIALVLLAIGIFIPWPGSTLRQNVSWSWIALVVGAAISFVPGRFFVLWLFLAFVLVIAGQSLFGSPRFVTSFFVYLSGAQLGAAVQLVYRRPRREYPRMKTRAAPTPIPTTKPDALIISVFPRDDTRWPDDGVERHGLVGLHSASGDQPIHESRQMGDLVPFASVIPVGESFELRVTATFGHEHYDRSLSFRVTGDEDDVHNYTVGPGLQRKSGRLGSKTVGGFEFGATVMGAQLEEMPLH